MSSFINATKLSVIEGLGAILIFLSLSIPSLKLLYSTPLLNIFCLAGLTLVVLLKLRVSLEYERKLLFVLWSAFSLLFFLLTLYGDYEKKLSYFLEMIYLFMMVLSIIALSNYNMLKAVGQMVFLWGMFIAIWQLVVGIKVSHEAGQHYLTVSMPLGAALAYTTRFFFASNDRLIKRLLFAASFVVIFLALGTLLSRSAFIYNALILILFSLSYLFINRSVSTLRKLFSVAALLFSIFIVYTNFSEKIELRQINRLANLLENADSESRMKDKYLPAMDYISTKPFLGYGVGASEGLYGNYPHNIFLEILSIGGIILLLPFSVMVFIFLKVGFAILKRHLDNPHLVGASAFSLFFFLQFNSSFPLVNAYIAIGSMVLLILGFYDYKKLADVYSMKIEPDSSIFLQVLESKGRKYEF
jgi:O-antigen ligase